MKDFKYYTLFGVNLTHGEDMIPKYSRDFILRWTSHEKENSELAQQMINNKLFETSKEEAIDLTNLGNETSSIMGIKCRMMHCPEISAHLFETKEPLQDEWLQIIIDSANISDHGKQLLAESKIRL